MYRQNALASFFVPNAQGFKVMAKRKAKSRVRKSKSAKGDLNAIAAGKPRQGKFAKLRGRATVTMTTDEILALTRDI
jgi:hypothetical protein